jgi:hypothetical protein
MKEAINDDGDDFVYVAEGIDNSANADNASQNTETNARGDNQRGSRPTSAASTNASSAQASSSAGVTVEEALNETGGFGKFQYLAVLSFQFMITNGSFSLYCMAFFELQPQYLCLIENEWTSCKTEDFCGSNPPVEFKVDWSSPLSLYNWIEEFDEKHSF